MGHARWGIGVLAALAGAAGCGSDVSTETGSAGTTGAGGSGAAGSGGASTGSSSASTGAGAETSSSVSAGGSSTGTGTGVGTGTGTGGATSSASAGGGGMGGSLMGVSCASDPPPGAPAPAPIKPYSGGVCPALVDGYNTITSNGNSRQFRLAIPANLQPNEKLPIIFLWHWLGGSPDDFFTKGEVQTAVDTQRFLAVIPDNKGDLLFKWPFESFQSQGRMDEEFAFFDDMLSCVSQQFDVNTSCVSSAGVSAGALFTDQLAGARAEYLSSFISLSGGVDGFVRPWAHPAHHLPGLVLWGGPSDFCVAIDFEQASVALEDALGQDGNFMIECIHNCGHSEPPLDPPPGLSKYAAIWQFALDHPFWIPAGQSPYSTPLPAGMPDWCAIGAGNAVPRVGACSGSGC
jgi:predicted esterase